MMMMLDSIDNGLLVYPTVEENGQTRPKKYLELTEAQQLQDDCDVQATNIILHGLPPDVYVLVNHLKAAKDIWDRGETLYEYYWRFSQLINDMHTIGMTMQQVQVYAYLSQHKRHANEVRITRERYPDPLALVANYPTLYNPSQSPQHSVTHQSQAEFPQMDSSLAVPIFQQGEDLIECINKAMAFMSAVASRFPPPNNQLRTLSNPRNQATIQDGRVTVQQEAGQILNEEQLAFLADPGISEAPVAQQTIAQNSVFQAEDLDAYDSDCDDLSSAKAVLMANLSSCDSDVLSEVLYSDTYLTNMLNQDVQEMQYSEQTHIDDFQDNKIHSDSNIIPYSQYMQESQDAVIQDTNSSTPNDLLVLSLVEQMTDHVAHLDKENQIK
ncbi:hypothetical protein Tco_1444743 [Tanacetum coccineum]